MMLMPCLQPIIVKARVIGDWSFVAMANIDGLHATDVRKDLFDMQIVTDGLPPGTSTFLKHFITTDAYAEMKGEYEFLMKYRQQFACLRYPPVFVTADSVVVCSGHILLVQRKANPGRNLFAIPGGFVEQNETLKEAAIRELIEETKLKIPIKVLNGSIAKSKIYDAPLRSQRMRTITNAFLVVLESGELPKVKGGSDAQKAFWMPLNEVNDNRDKFFDDHFHIIEDLIGI